MSHLVPLSHALAVGWTVELLAEMNLPIRGEFVDFTNYRLDPPTPCAKPQASHWRDTAMKLSDDLVRERDVSLAEARRSFRYMLLAGAGWIAALAILVNGWAL